jgi:hypothetical protein
MFIISERIGKYILSVVLCLGLLSAVGALNKGLISDVISIAIGFLVSNLLLGLMKVILGNFEDAVKVTGDTEKLLGMYEGTKKTASYNGTEGYVAYSEVLVNEGYSFERSNILLCSIHNKDLHKEVVEMAAIHTNNMAYIQNLQTSQNHQSINPIHRFYNICQVKLPNV